MGLITNGLTLPCFIHPTHCHRVETRWRAQERVPRAFTHCPTCKFAYEIVEVEGEAESRKRDLRFGCLIARDSCGVIIATQAIIALLAFLLHAADRDARLVSFFPAKWAERASNHFVVGPYYVSATLLLLACLGLVGAFLKWTGRLPQRPVPTLPRHQRHRSCCSCCCDARCCQGCYFFPDPYVCTVAPGSCDGCCNACCIGGGCDGSCGAGLVESCMSGAAGEGSVILLPIALILLVVFALIGVVVGIFFATIIFQRVVQRHIHLLAMRSETQRVVVVDLAQRETLARRGGVVAGNAPQFQAMTMRGRIASTATEGLALPV